MTTPQSRLKYSQYFLRTKVLIENSGISDRVKSKKPEKMSLKTKIKNLIEPPEKAREHGVFAIMTSLSVTNPAIAREGIERVL